MNEQNLSLNCQFIQKSLSSSARIFVLLMILSLLISLAACSGTTGDKDDSLPPHLYPQPQTIELKASPPIPTTAKIIHPDSVSKPQSFTVDHAALTINTHPNQHRIPNDLTTIPVEKSLLKTIKVGEGKRDFVLLSSTGDTIPTGVPIPAQGKVVKAIHSRPTKALPPSTKDAAIAHLQFLNVEHGMTSSLVYSVIEDKSGNIWMGTDGGGISVFNGKSFTHYTEKEGLSSNIVWSIIEDNSGNIWIGTFGGGVSVFDGESFTHYTEKEGLSSNTVWTIKEDRNGNIWLGTEGGGVSVFNGKRFTHYTEKEGLSDNTVRAIMEDKSGNIWLGTMGGGVSVFNGKSLSDDKAAFTHYTEKDGLSDNYIYSILEDKSGNIWLGTDVGINIFDGKSFTHYTEKEGLSNNYINAILEDKSGNIWVGTDGGGVSVLNVINLPDANAVFTHYGEKEGLSSNRVTSIIEDKSGNIWLGTRGGGVNILNGAGFTYYTMKESSTSNAVGTIKEDKSGNIWLGTTSNGVSVFNGKSLSDDKAGFTNYTEKEGLSNNNVSAILEDKKGNMWLGTIGGGVNVFNGEIFTNYTVSEGLSDDTIWSILEDKSGNIWLGTFGGVSVFNGESLSDGKSGFTHYTEKEGLSYNTVYSILEDKSGNIWLATDGGGVNVFDGESFNHYTVKDGLAFNIVSSMIEDKNGNIWLGTIGGGVSVFNGKGFTNYTENEGLANNIVWSLLEDKNTALNEVSVYVGTEKGLSKISLKESITTGDKGLAFSIQNFGKQDGLKGLNFLRGATIDSKNHAWWGTANGLVMLDLNTFSFSDKIPQPRLTQLEVNEQYLDFHNISDTPENYWDQIKFNGVKKFENYPLNLKLPYDKNHLTFHFIAIDWAAPHKIQYSHKMEGLQTNWSQPTTDAVADYRNLPFGTYTFQIRAIGESGVWSEPFEYAFTILPPWWHTWWAYTIYVFLFLGILRIFSLWRERRLRQEKEQLQVKVEERTGELKKKSEELEHSLHDLKSTQAQLIQSEKMASLGELTAGIAHEIQNPLNFVNNFSEVSNELIDEMNEELDNGDIEEAKAISTDIKQNLEKITHHGKRAGAIVKGMLAHSRSSSGKKEPTDINALADEYLRLSYHGIRARDKSFNADFKTAFDANLPKINVVPQDIGRVLLNLINNAFQAVYEKSQKEGSDYKPHVTISTKLTANSQLLITISDNGSGIPENIKDKIFQPFFTTKPTGQGTGLGLSLSYDIVKAHGGEISVESAKGKGTEFIIKLPDS